MPQDPQTGVYSPYWWDRRLRLSMPHATCDFCHQRYECRTDLEIHARDCGCRGVLTADSPRPTLIGLVPAALPAQALPPDDPTVARRREAPAPFPLQLREDPQ